MDSFEVVVDDTLYLRILRQLGALWTMGEATPSPERLVISSAVEAWL